MKNFEQYSDLNESYKQEWTRKKPPAIIPESEWKDTLIPNDLLFKDKLSGVKSNDGKILYPNNIRKKFLKKTVWIAEQLNIDPDILMSIYNLECSFNYTTVNSSGATGLIQITKSNARDLYGSKIPRFDVIRQLDYVYHFLQRSSKGKDLKTVADHYIGLVWLPAAYNKENSVNIVKKYGQLVYDKNAPLFRYYPKGHPKHETLENIRLSIESGSINQFKPVLAKHHGKEYADTAAYRVIDKNLKSDIADAKNYSIKTKKTKPKTNMFSTLKKDTKTKTTTVVKAVKPVNIKKVYSSIEELGKAIAEHPENLTYA